MFYQVILRRLACKPSAVAGRGSARKKVVTLQRLRWRKRLSDLRVVRPRPSAANQAWALDFVHNGLKSGRPFRALTVDFSTLGRTSFTVRITLPCHLAEILSSHGSMKE